MIKKKKSLICLVINWYTFLLFFWLLFFWLWFWFFFFLFVLFKVITILLITVATHSLISYRVERSSQRSLTRTIADKAVVMVFPFRQYLVLYTRKKRLSAFYTNKAFDPFLKTLKQIEIDENKIDAGILTKFNFESLNK